jgi:hypothetical protein
MLVNTNINNQQVYTRYVCQHFTSPNVNIKVAGSFRIKVNLSLQ